MTIEQTDASADLFGLSAHLPRPGWIVLDAPRDHRFTGELVCDSTPEVRVYLDRGRIYLAERVTDPRLGARLVDAGVVSAAQLEHGTMRLGEHDHLGRLFERVPSIDRHRVMVVTELMTDECVGWLATQRVRAVARPYRHHPSGVQRWDRPSTSAPSTPGSPLPAPDPDDEPVEIGPPEPLFSPADEFDDGLIQWDEPSWLDERPVADSRSRSDDPTPTWRPTARPGIDASLDLDPPRFPGARPPLQDDPQAGEAVHAAPPAPNAPPVPPASPASPASIVSDGQPDTPHAVDDDWVERLEHDGLPEPGADPMSVAFRFPATRIEPVDRFELIWPSGDVDDEFDADHDIDLVGTHPDLDFTGQTARVMRGGIDRADEPHQPPARPRDRTPAPTPEPDEITDEVVLSVRRAVAQIETGSLDSRRRLADASGPDGPRNGDLVMPGRLSLHDPHEEPHAETPVRQHVPVSARSIFGEEPADAVVRHPQRTAPEEPGPQGRVGALRRLISGLRRA